MKISKKGIIDIIHSRNTSLSPTEAWELIKRKVKDYSINFAKYEQKSIKKNKINGARNKRNRIKSAENFNYKRIKTLEAELNALYDKKSKGVQIGPKVKWIE